MVTVNKLEPRTSLTVVVSRRAGRYLPEVTASCGTPKTGVPVHQVNEIETRGRGEGVGGRNYHGSAVTWCYINVSETAGAWVKM